MGLAKVDIEFSELRFRKEYSEKDRGRHRFHPNPENGNFLAQFGDFPTVLPTVSYALLTYKKDVIPLVLYFGSLKKLLKIFVFCDEISNSDYYSSLKSTISPETHQINRKFSKKREVEMFGQGHFANSIPFLVGMPGSRDSGCLLFIYPFTLSLFIHPSLIAFSERRGW